MTREHVATAPRDGAPILLFSRKYPVLHPNGLLVRWRSAKRGSSYAAGWYVVPVDGGESYRVDRNHTIFDEWLPYAADANDDITQAQAMRARYHVHGETLQSIADAYGVTRQRVSKIVGRKRRPPGSPGGPPIPEPKRSTTVDAIAAMVDGGLTIEEVAAAYKKPLKTLVDECKRRGVRVRLQKSTSE